MEEIVISDRNYDRVFKSNGVIKKISVMTQEESERLKRKELDFINCPIAWRALTKEEQQKYSNGWTKYNSLITLPFLYGYKDLDIEDFTKDLTTKQILQLCKRNLQLLKKMHESGLIHADINETNIMINSNLDIRFIDFEASIIDEIILPENTYFEEDISFNEKRVISMFEDKKELLRMYIAYLAKGKFSLYDSSISDATLGMMPYQKRELRSIRLCEKIDEDYYFIDFIDDLIETKYESPVLVKRNTSKL